MGGKKDNQLQEWLLKNKRYVLENMTTTWLMGKDGQGGIPQAIQKQIDGKWVNYPDWVGKKIDRETTSTDLAEQHKVYSSIKLDKRNRPLQLTARYDAAKWHKSSFAGLMADDLHKSTAGSSPDSNVVKYYHFGRVAESSSTAFTAMTVYVEVMYYCLWRQPKDHTGS